MTFLAEFGITSFLYTFAICLIITLTIFKWYRERNYPPGPIGIPILGYSVFLGKKPNEKLHELTQKYGGIFSFYMGSDLYMCIGSYDIMKELLPQPALLFRAPESFDFIIGKAGMGGISGEEWQEQRRFAFHTMRNLGLGKGPWENLIKENIVNLIEEIKSWKGEPTDIENPITNSQSDTNMALLFGRHLDKEEDAETIQILRYSTREFMQHFSAISVNVSMAWLRNIMIFFNIGGYKRFYVLLRQFENIFKKEVEKRMETPESLSKDDFIGCFFKELEKREKETKDHSFTIETLMGNLLILFIAGNDSTMASLSWLFLIMADRPDVQKKVHEEIDNIIGRDGSVTYDDRNKFPYTMATIFEMLRWVSVAPISPARLAVEEIQCNGYTIPKGALLISNIWGIMRDPKYFENPEKYQPERFLTEDRTKVLTRLDGYAPFSLGKRNCPGEGVAVMTTFLYFVSILQKFRVTLPPGKVADLEPIFGGALLIKPQKLCFTER